jgi:glutamyl-tRNA reductase
MWVCPPRSFSTTLNTSSDFKQLIKKVNKNKELTMTTKHKVLLIGSGLMTPPLIDYLLSFNDTHISVVSNLVEDARALAKKAPKFMDADFLDVTDVSTFSPLS